MYCAFIIIVSSGMGKGRGGVVLYVVVCNHYHSKFGNGYEASAAAVRAAVNAALKPSKYGRAVSVRTFS